MYIRRTQTCNTSSGESYYTYRLVRSERVGGKVNQLTLLNLGRHFDVVQTQWPVLCTRIEELLSGQVRLMPVPCPAMVERQAQRITAQLVALPAPVACWTGARQRPDGHALHVRKATQPEGKHLEICRALAIDALPGGIEKLIH